MRTILIIIAAILLLIILGGGGAYYIYFVKPQVTAGTASVQEHTLKSGFIKRNSMKGHLDLPSKKRNGGLNRMASPSV